MRVYLFSRRRAFRWTTRKRTEVNYAGVRGDWLLFRRCQSLGLCLKGSFWTPGIRPSFVSLPTGITAGGKATEEAGLEDMMEANRVSCRTVTG